MSYKHGVFITEQETAILPPRRVTATLPVAFGTAPVHMLASGSIGPVNEPQLVYTYQEAVGLFGSSTDWEKYTLCEFFSAFFGLYQMAPMVVINVFDPDVHKTAFPEGAASFDGDELQLDHAGIIDGSLVVKSSDGLTTYEIDTDYTVNLVTGLVSRVDTGSIAADADVLVSYDYGDPSLVDSDDIIGGIDAGTGAKTGLELLGEVFPRFRLVPGQVLAPGWSDDPAVAIAMAGKASSINNHFKAICLVDLPVTVTKYSDAPSHKTTNNLTDEQMVVCWPKVKLGDDSYWLSSQMAGLICSVTADHEDVPYKSPSNERLQINAVVAGSDELWLGPEEASYLNGQGIVTPLNFVGGWKAWGNRTGTYPGVTDPKDSFLPVRMMFNWIGNTLVLSWWQRIDFPITRRLIETVVDSNNIWLNGLASREFLLGGKVMFLEEENPDTDLIDGIIRFHVYLTPPSPAREIDFVLEYDPAELTGLFE